MTKKVDTEKTVNFDISADLSYRKGLYSNLCMARSVEDEVILDFCLLDDSEIDEHGNLVKHGTVVSRIVVTKKIAEDIANMINQHLGR